MMRQRTISSGLMVVLACWICPLSAQADPGVKYISPKTTVAIVAKPAAIWKSKPLAMLPTELLEIEARQIFGATPDQIESVMLLAAVENLSDEPQLVFVIKAAEPLKIKELFPQALARGELALRKHPETGVEYLKAENHPAFDVYPVDETTLIATHSHLLSEFFAVEDRPVESPLAKLVMAGPESAELQAFMVMEPFREIANQAMADLPIPQVFSRVRNIPNQLKDLQLTVQMQGKWTGANLLLNAESAEDAEQLEQTITMLMNFAQAMALEAVTDQHLAPERAEAMAKYQARIAQTIRETLNPVREGEQLTISTGDLVGEAGSIATTGVLVGLMLPAVNQAREAARRAQSTNNLKQIGLAMHNYHEAYKQFPPAVQPDQPKSRLSWRVHILPFIGEAELYDQFKLDEPWDSEHNRKLVDRMPGLYVSPDSPEIADAGMTRYQRPRGEGLPMSVEGRLRISDLTDGTVHTIMAVESPVEQAVVWTQPDDLEVDMDNPIGTLANALSNGFNAAFYDGSVHFISNSVDNQVLKKILTHAGGEPVNFP